MSRLGFGVSNKLLYPANNWKFCFGVVFVSLLLHSCGQVSGGDPVNQPSDAGSRVSPWESRKDLDADARGRADDQFKALQEQLKQLEGKLTNVTTQAERVSGEFSLPPALLQKTMLWTSSLQLLSAQDMAGTVSQQTAFVNGSKVAYFKQVAGQVLLLSRESLDFESDAEGENVLARFEIISADAQQLRLRAKEVGGKSAALLGVRLAEGAATYLRSIDFDIKDSALIMEVTFEDAEGNYYNVLEGVLPRSRLVREPLDKAGVEEQVGGAVEIVEPEQGKENDKTHYPTLLKRLGVFPVTSWFAPQPSADLNPAADLSQVVKTQKSFVAKFDISGGKTIDWWVTNNIPDTLLPEIKAGVEGWNRYFNSFRPANQVMVFRGKLPQGIKVGDPRYNVIFFDAVSEAGAAYESQSVDPISGLQTHSLIYMPFAWYNISGQRWSQNGDSSAKNRLARIVAKAKERKLLKCYYPVNYKDAAFMVQGRAATSADEAGRALMRSTLLHEVGHALGMDHNFKGTLLGDVRKYNETSWQYSSSTMDYNPFAMEDTLFEELGNPNRDVTRGLIQEYDRQFIDIVYNAGKQTIERGENAFPFCNDAMHDDLTNGVDPFCRQYDFFGDVSQTLSVPLARLSSDADFLPANEGGFITLQGLLRQMSSTAMSDVGAIKPSKLTQGGPSAAALQKIAESFVADSSQAFSHLLISGSYSLQSALTRDMRLLGEWKPMDNVKQGTEASHWLGLEIASQYIPNLFLSNGELNTAAYKAKENSVQRQMSEAMAEVFSVGLGAHAVKFVGGRSSGHIPKSLVLLQQAQQNLHSALLAKVQPGEKLLLQEALVQVEQLLSRRLNTILARASANIANELGSIIVVSSYTGGQAQSRPAVAPMPLQRLFFGLSKLAMRKSFDISTRSLGVAWMQTLHFWASQWEQEGAESVKGSESSTAPTAEEGSVKAANKPDPALKEQRVQELARVKSQLEEEKAPLLRRMQQGKYLSAAERDLLEFLTSSLQVLAESGAP